MLSSTATLQGIVAAVAAILGSVLFNAAYPLAGRMANLLAVPVLMFAQVVVGSIVLSEMQSINLSAFLVFHVVCLLLSLLLWTTRGRQDPRALYRFRMEEFLELIRLNPLLSAFVVALLAWLVFISLQSPFTPGDAAQYHLPRAHYWIQHETARHFYTDDMRQIQFPPNSSFLTMWQILVTGSYAGLHLPQWSLAWTTALAIAAICRLAGHSRSAAVFSSALYLSLPGVVLQMSTPLNDLITAFTGVAFVYFALAGTMYSARCNSTNSMRSLGYAGIAFGVFVGTKLTALFILPPLGLLVLALLIRRYQYVVRSFGRLSGACILGFLALGAYNYMLNLVDFGNPIASQAAVEFQAARSAGAIEEGKSPLGNVARYTYQVMDWVIIQPIPGIDTLYAVNNALYRRLDRLLKLNMESVPAFNLRDFGMRRLIAGEVGFGPIGYMMVIVSPVVLAVMLFRGRQDDRVALSVTLLVLAIGWFVSFSSLLPWWDSRIRYAALFFAILVPALAPYLYQRSRLALIWLAPLMSLALWCAIQTSSVAGNFEENDRALAAWQIEVLRSSLPPDARIAVVGGVEFHHYLKEAPRYRFSPAPEAQVLPSLMSGTIDAALVFDPDDTLFLHRLPIEQDQSLLVRNPLEIIRANLGHLGITLGSQDGMSLMRMEHSGLVRRWGPDLVQIFIPTVGPVALPDGAVLEIRTQIPAPRAEVLSLECNGYQVALHVSGDLLSGHIAGAIFSSDRPYQLCKLRISDRGFGSSIRSDEIEVRVHSFDDDYAEPPRLQTQGR